ncbi:MAG: leucine-rich repeat domain-containing protein [Holosporales bacterium]|jgi:hypothetical protein|nr:leucine-rich repeat domain-containing protein [Holosporales bacterium]
MKLGNLLIRTCILAATCLNQHTHANQDARKTIILGGIQYTKIGEGCAHALVFRGERSDTRPENHVDIEGEELTVTDLTFERNYHRTVSEVNILIPSSVTTITNDDPSLPRAIIMFESGSKLTKIERFTFCNTQISKIRIPASVRLIDHGCFSGCHNLREIIFEEGSNITSINVSEFRKCTELKEICIPKFVQILRAYCFSECEKLEHVEFKTIHSLVISDYAFFKCPNLKSVDIPNGAKRLGLGCFSWSGLEKITFGEDSRLKFIDEGAFWNCNLGQINIPSNVEEIGERCFGQCKELEHVTFAPNSKLKKIGQMAFAYCDKLTQITFPASVTSLPRHCFALCKNLQSITFESCEPISIDFRALIGCPSLTKIFAPAGVTVVNKMRCRNVFRINCNDDKLIFEK